MKTPIKIISILFVIICSFYLTVKSQDITSGLVAHYKLENSSGDVTDETGNNNGSVSLSGITRGVPGKVGTNAFQFDGSNGYVNIPASSHINPPNPYHFTLAYWVKSDGSQGSYDRISGFTGYDFEVAVGETTNEIKIYNGAWKNTGYQITYNTWTHITSTYDGTTYKIYVNGAFIQSYERINRALSGDLYIASNYAGGENFDGCIDDVRMYNRELSATDVAELCSPGSGSTPTIILNNISVNEGDGTVPFTISLNKTSSQLVTGSYSAINNTALAGSDYVAQSGSFSIAAGQLSTTINVTITDDTAIESDESFNFTISNPTNASILNTTSVCTILDNDATEINCSNTITSYPYSEGFEDATNTWTNISGDDIDWTRKTGSTPSSYTGPTSAQEGTFYYFIEASSPNYPTKTAILYGPCVDLTGKSSAELTFYYHMYGAAMGTLILEASIDGASWTSLWSLSGDQGNSWQQASVNLSSYVNNTVKLRLRGTTGSSYTGDISIDNLNISATDGGGGTLWSEHSNGTDIFYNSGKVGIGTSLPDEVLTVKGTIHSEEVIVDTNVPVPDYVFANEYNLRSITNLEEFLKKHSHLPDIPSAAKMEEEGISLSYLNLMLLKQIEELTLYIIDQEKRISEIENLKNEK